MAEKFGVGDRVVRHENFLDDYSPLMHGEVTNVYSLSPAMQEVYAVKWDGETRVKRGYLPEGLEHDN